MAQAVCQSHGVTLIQQAANIDEIQSEDPELIIQKKAQAAFRACKQPVIVSDDSWAIPALRGLPGPYMKSINHWLTESDWLHLMQPYQERTILLIQLLAYQDEHGYKYFRSERRGSFLHEARGKYGSPVHKVVTMDEDNGLSIAEVYDQGIQHGDRANTADWTAFLNWYQAKMGITS